MIEVGGKRTWKFAGDYGAVLLEGGGLMLTFKDEVIDWQFPSEPLQERLERLRVWSENERALGNAEATADHYGQRAERLREEGARLLGEARAEIPAGSEVPS